MKKVSIIVPCYNVEKYIVRCLKSIENQTFGIDKLEVILVNDGSSDNTISYLKAFKNKYMDSVIIIDFEHNRGLSMARNAGLDMASCEYVLFIDSDDTIDKTAVEKMYDKADEFDCDIVSSTYKSISHEKDEISCRRGDDWYKELDNPDAA